MRISRSFLFGLVALPGALFAQDGGERPMSAIDWLSDSVTTPVAMPAPAEPGVSGGAAVEPVSVAPLDRARADAVGLLPRSVTGLPRDLWGASRPEDLARRFREERADMLPALQALLYTLLLAELDPPDAGATDGAQVFLARIDKLLELGALDQAEALLTQAGMTEPEIFRRGFDVSLLIGHEDMMCEVLRATPELSPTFPARIFCLARGGDWNAATLTLGTGQALGYITQDDDALFARFLDPDLFEGEPPLPKPDRPTPLNFRMFEAIGEPMSTALLPRAFAQADLRANIGWKARIEAGERLIRTGAIGANQLFGLYGERTPAASGGVWDRVTAIQALDRALEARDGAAISAALPAAWAAMEEIEAEVPFADYYAEALRDASLSPEARQLAIRIGLLSRDYEAVAATMTPRDDFERFLQGLARGTVAGLAPAGPEARAIADAFAADEAPVRLRSLLDNDRLGEAILRAMSLFTNGTHGDLDELSDGLALLRAVGLEDTARRATLEYLLLERRG